MIKLPYPLNALPAYTTVPCAAATTEAPCLLVICNPLKPFSLLEKRCVTLPLAGQFHTTFALELRFFSLIILLACF